MDSARHCRLDRSLGWIPRPVPPSQYRWNILFPKCLVLEMCQVSEIFRLENICLTKVSYLE